LLPPRIVPHALKHHRLPAVRKCADLNLTGHKLNHAAMLNHAVRQVAPLRIASPNRGVNVLPPHQQRGGGPNLHALKIIARRMPFASIMSE
jgi:hypothetical protein